MVIYAVLWQVARNEHLAIDQDITYVSGVKRGAKRLRVGP